MYFGYQIQFCDPLLSYHFSERKALQVKVVIMRYQEMPLRPSCRPRCLPDFLTPIDSRLTLSHRAAAAAVSAVVLLLFTGQSESSVA